MVFNNIISIALCVFVVVINIENSFQHQRVSTNLTFCAQKSSEVVVKNFWKQSLGSCAMDPQKLLDLYETSSIKLTSSCDLLLQHHIRSTLIESLSKVYVDSMIGNHGVKNNELDEINTRLIQRNPHIAQAALERAIDEVYLFVDGPKLVDFLYLNVPNGLNVFMLLYLQEKSSRSYIYDARLSTKMAHFLLMIKSNKGLTDRIQREVTKAIEDIPKQVAALYTNRTIQLINIEHWEFLYAPVNADGPDKNRRTPFTWLGSKNNSDYSSDLLLEVNSNGDVAFSTVYNNIYYFLYVDTELNQPFFWLGGGVPAEKWWQPEWHGDYLTIMNLASRKLLCATLVANHFRRYATLQPYESGEPSGDCRWDVRKPSTA